MVFVVLLLLLLAFICDKTAFGKRSDKSPLLKYFTAEDFSLHAQPVALEGRLNGFIYGDGERDKIIIFCHGMGPGQIAYTTEIAYFCSLGYKVLALDSTGCNLSGGRSIRGFYEGVKTAVKAIDYAKSNYPDKKIVLVGHSWGAYSVLCASAERNVEKVVAVSAPDSPAKTVSAQAATIIPGPLAATLTPFLYAVNFFKFGPKGNSDAAKCAKKSGIPALLVHGDKDKVVPESRAVYYNADGGHIVKLLAEGKAHNPYNTVGAEKYLSEIIAAHNRAGKMSEEQKEFFKNIDFKVATEEDGEIMREIAGFIA